MRSALETPLSRRSYPSGQTSAFVMKALLKYLDANKGKAVSEQWLKSIHALRDDLEDETRAMPLTTLHRALQRFAEAASREAIGEMWNHLIAPDNLGVWMRILRGTIVARCIRSTEQISGGGDDIPKEFRDEGVDHYIATPLLDRRGCSPGHRRCRDHVRLGPVA